MKHITLSVESIRAIIKDTKNHIVELEKSYSIIKETSQALKIIDDAAAIYNTDIDREITYYIDKESSIIEEELEKVLNFYFTVLDIEDNDE